MKMEVEVDFNTFLTSEVDAGEWSPSSPGSYPGERAPINNGQKSAWAPEPIWGRCPRKINFAPARNQSWLSTPFPRHFTD
jgi:hypothetical protein